jgi:hypothetical protein
LNPSSPLAVHPAVRSRPVSDRAAELAWLRDMLARLEEDCPAREAGSTDEQRAQEMLGEMNWRLGDWMSSA